METGTRSLRRAFKKGSCRDCPLAIGFSLFCANSSSLHSRGTAYELPCSAILKSQASIPHLGGTDRHTMITRPAPPQSPNAFSPLHMSRFHDSSDAGSSHVPRLSERIQVSCR